MIIRTYYSLACSWLASSDVRRSSSDLLKVVVKVESIPKKKCSDRLSCCLSRVVPRRDFSSGEEKLVAPLICNT